MKFLQRKSTQTTKMRWTLLCKVILKRQKKSNKTVEPINFPQGNLLAHFKR